MSEFNDTAPGTFLEVVSIETSKVVHTMNVNSRVAFIDKVMAGMLRQIDTSKFFVREVTR